jgi:dipeptidyl aminopeptidase/acylaminoacyl peptidase
MMRIRLQLRDLARGAWVVCVAALILAALPLLAASTLGAPVMQTMRPVGYLPLVKGLPLPPYYRIAFVSSRDGNAEIYAMNADGSHQTNLTNNPARDAGAVWSPDSRQIMFLSDRDGNEEIYVMNADGSSQTNLTNDSARDGYPAWSPNGRRIAFEREGDIYVMNADGSNQTNLTNDSARDGYPAWSPTIHERSGVD